MLFPPKLAAACSLIWCLCASACFPLACRAESPEERQQPASAGSPAQEPQPADSAGSPAQEPQPAAAESAAPQPADEDQSFEIYEFNIQGNTLFGSERLTGLLDDLVGPGKSAADVEKGRDILESFYHDAGYPTVLVNIPEQKVEGGTVRLQVIESRVRATTVTGNRHFSTGLILDKVPSLAPGSVLYLPDVQLEINRLNRNPDLKVTPAMSAGKELGSVDMELKVQDALPLHGSLEVNNRASHDTTPLRVNAGAHYDNLWGLRHSLSLMYQFSPQDFNEVEVATGTYTAPAPWNEENSLTLYGLYSNSNTTFGSGFSTLGKGDVIGARYIVALPPADSYTHSAVFGLDYKNFAETTGTSGGTVSTPVEYLPFSAAYSGSLPDATGLTLFNATFNAAFRGLVAREQQFSDKRYRARTNYLFANLGVERRQQFASGAALSVKLDGQLADQPLISNEQYSAGGSESVRGYQESEVSGDNALHGSIELSAPNLAPKGYLDRFRIAPYAFFDGAAVWVKDPLAGQDSAMDLQGAGLGVRGFAFRDFEYQCDWAYALVPTGRIRSGDQRVYFKVKYQF